MSGIPADVIPGISNGRIRNARSHGNPATNGNMSIIASSFLIPPNTDIDIKKNGRVKRMDKSRKILFSENHFMFLWIINSNYY